MGTGRESYPNAGPLHASLPRKTEMPPNSGRGGRGASRGGRGKSPGTGGGGGSSRGTGRVPRRSGLREEDYDEVDRFHKSANKLSLRVDDDDGGFGE